MSEVHPQRRTRKGKFTPEEDAVIAAEVNHNGVGSWENIASKLTNRTAREVRDRYKFYISIIPPSQPWTPNEDMKLLRLAEEHQQRFSRIVHEFPARTECDVKNRYHELKKKFSVHHSTSTQTIPWIENTVPNTKLSFDSLYDLSDNF
jgi:hypothetical protein